MESGKGRTHPLTTPMIRHARPSNFRMRLVMARPKLASTKPMIDSMAPNLIPTVIHPSPLNKCTSSSVRWVLSIRRWFMKAFMSRKNDAPKLSA